MKVGKHTAFMIDFVSDDDFRVAVNNALCDLLETDEPDLL